MASCKALRGVGTRSRRPVADSRFAPGAIHDSISGTEGSTLSILCARAFVTSSGSAVRVPGRHRLHRANPRPPAEERVVWAGATTIPAESMRAI